MGIFSFFSKEKKKRSTKAFPKQKKMFLPKSQELLPVKAR